MRDLLSFDILRQRLVSEGHQVQCDATVPAGFTVFPTPDMLITVASYPDFPFGEEFWVVPDPDPDLLFRQLSCPESHRSRWLRLVSRQPPSFWRDFLGGPGTWVLGRLARLSEIVFWADQELDWRKIDNPLHRSWGMQVPSAAAGFFAPAWNNSHQGPQVISVEEDSFPDVLAACFLFANVSTPNSYLADARATEVYVLNNDERVFGSVPDDRLRGDLLQELRNNPCFFKST
jgi:hypothetical protein